MNAQVVKSCFEIAEIHAEHVRSALKEILEKGPITIERLENLSRYEFLLLDLYNHRFAKLQDLMGAELFDLALEAAQESLDGLTIIDKVNKLEKLLVIPDANRWFKLREIRNHISHEYPGNRALEAKHLNDALSEGSYLLECLRNLQKFMKRIEEHAGKKIENPS